MLTILKWDTDERWPSFMEQLKQRIQKQYGGQIESEFLIRLSVQIWKQAPVQPYRLAITPIQNTLREQACLLYYE